MAPIVITEAEILEALAVSVKGTSPKGAKTLAEICAESGVTERRARAALSLLKQQGRLLLHHIPRETLDGRMVNTPAYTILPKKK